MSKLQPLRGTHDVLPEEARRHRHVVETALAVAGRHGYGEIVTPIFEMTEVFQRTLGESSDVVAKEMYTFADRGGDGVTLRPEGTAGVARAVISGGLQQAVPLKFFYQGPMFRYERPQKGRQRQFHQIGAELIGVPGPLGDVEVIALGAQILDALGVLDKTTLHLNTLGDQESRRAYRDALVAYFGGHRGALSEDSLRRLTVNPLRILDSKDDGDRAVVADAPAFGDYLNDASRCFFEDVKDGLTAAGIAFHLDPRLVRGLDYYCHSAFEFVTDALGAQGTVMGGGRYDGLIATMGGPSTAGVGWAAGIERLAMLLADMPPPARPIAIVPLGALAERRALALAQDLRRRGLTIELGFSGNMGKRLKRADKLNARAAVILGDDELKRASRRSAIWTPARKRKSPSTAWRTPWRGSLKAAATMVEDAPSLEDFTVIGLDFRDCPDDLRHDLFVDDRELPAVLTALAAGGADAGVVVSTCDRIEVSMTLPPAADATALVASTLAAAGDLPADQVAPYLRRRQGRPAVEHVFRVAAALDSQVVGESQVLGQVKACHGHARAHGLARGLVDQVFQAAFAPPRRSATRPPSAPVRPVWGHRGGALSSALHGDLANCAGLMLGGGEAGAVLSEDLRRAGLADLCVLDPHPRRARAMARQLGGHHGDFADLGGHLVRGDIVLAALGDGRYALNAEMIEAVLRQRRRRPVMIFDLAVPSDLDPAVNRLEDVFVFTLDDLEDGAAEARARARRQRWRRRKS